MADNYLEKRYEQTLGSQQPKVKRVGVTVEQLLKRNRSCRGYNTAYKVPRETLRELVRMTRYTPSACNQQVLRYRLVTHEEAPLVLKEIKLGAALPELHLPLPDTQPEAFIVVCCDKPESKLVDMDLGIVLQTMLLRATEMGLNGLIIGAFNRESLRLSLNIPSTPIAVLAVGKGIENIQLVDIRQDDDHKYYRRDGIHYVPKVILDDLIIE